MQELISALSDANSADRLATILIQDGTYVLEGRVLVVQCPGLMVRSKSGKRDAVVLRGSA